MDLKIKTIKVIDVDDWDKLVQETYGKIYKFQQQYGCQERGHYPVIVPLKIQDEFEDNLEIPLVVNGAEEGVNFEVWKNTPNDKFNKYGTENHMNDLFWRRNYYPDIQMIANDLYDKGLIPAGEYQIDVNW